MKYNAVLFDIDDTLLKTWQVKWQQHKYVAKRYYGVDLADEILAEHWGKPFDTLTAALYNNAGTADDRRQNYGQHELEYPKEYHDDTLELLDALRAANIALGLVTSMHWQGARIDLDNLQMPLHYFAILQGADATQFHKPDPRVFDPAKATLASLGITDNVVYVGDALSDYFAARDAGFDFIGVTTGFVDEQEFKRVGAAQVVPRLSHVTQIVL